MVRRLLSAAEPQSVARPRGRAHGGAHHLSVGGGAAPQVRPQPTEPRGADLRLRRRFPGRELPAPPGDHVRRAFRRQLVSLYHPRLRLFRPGGGARRRARQRLPRRGDAVLHHLVHQRLALSDAREPRDRARAERRGGKRQLRRGRDRQGPRRLSARRARIPRHAARLSRRLRPASRPARSMSVDARAFNPPSELRGDLRLVGSMIEPETRVLDIGCGDGELLYYLVHSKGIDGRGMELSQSGVNSCVRHGLSVIQGDADNDLEDYPSDAFDYVVLSQTLQATRKPREVLLNLVRIGRHAIVSFPNFGHWRIRMSLLIAGRLPSSALLPYPWYDTPNIHLCTIRDFALLCRDEGIRVERSVSLDRYGRPYTRALANLIAEQGLFLLSRTR